MKGEGVRGCGAAMDYIDAVLQDMSHSNCHGKGCDESWVLAGGRSAVASGVDEGVDPGENMLDLKPAQYISAELCRRYSIAVGRNRSCYADDESMLRFAALHLA
jgi:hypothetical protein